MIQENKPLDWKSPDFIHKTIDGKEKGDIEAI